MTAGQHEAVASAEEQAAAQHQKQYDPSRVEQPERCVPYDGLDCDVRWQPNVAHRARAAESQIGLLLPCNVVVQQAPNGGMVVSIADPRARFTLVDKSAVWPAAAEAEERLGRVIDAVGGREAV